MRNERWMRIESLVVSVAFFATNVAGLHAAESQFWASRAGSVREQQRLMDPTATRQSAPSGANPEELLKSAISIQRSPALSDDVSRSLPVNFAKKNAKLFAGLPLALGSVREVSFPAKGHADRTVVLIQDIHLHQEAQTNISKTLQSLAATKDLGVIGLEGAWRTLDLSWFQQFPDRDAVKNVAGTYLKANKITGGAHGAMTADGFFPKVVGVDDQPHYMDNIAAYKGAVPLQGQLRFELAEARQKLAAEMDRSFPSELRTLVRASQDHGDQRLSLTDYVSILSKAQTLSESSSVRAFVTALALEKSIRFDAVDAQRNALIAQLTRGLNEKAMQQLLERTLALRAGGIRAGDYYLALQDICARAELSLSKYPDFNKYVRYVVQTEKINAEVLFRDLQELERSAQDRLAKTPDQKRLLRTVRWVGLVGRMAEFALTPPEWDAYQNLRADALPLRTSLTPFERFFLEAKIRDSALADNLVRAMTDESARTAALVVGGFHSGGLTSILNRAGVAVISFTPRVSKIDEKGGSYLTVFNQEKTPLDKLFAGERLFVTIEPAGGSAIAGMGAETLQTANLLPDVRSEQTTRFTELLKNWLPKGANLSTDPKGNITVQVRGRVFKLGRVDSNASVISKSIYVYAYRSVSFVRNALVAMAIVVLSACGGGTPQINADSNESVTTPAVPVIEKLGVEGYYRFPPRQTATEVGVAKMKIEGLPLTQGQKSELLDRGSAFTQPPDFGFMESRQGTRVGMITGAYPGGMLTIFYMVTQDGKVARVEYPGATHSFGFTRDGNFVLRLDNEVDFRVLNSDGVEVARAKDVALADPPILSSVNVRYTNMFPSLQNPNQFETELNNVKALNVLNPRQLAELDPSRGGGDFYVENVQLGTLVDGVSGIRLIVFRGVERSRSFPNFERALTIAYIIGLDGVPHRVDLDKVVDLRGFAENGDVLLSFPEKELRMTYVIDPTNGRIVGTTKRLLNPPAPASPIPPILPSVNVRYTNMFPSIQYPYEFATELNDLKAQNVLNPSQLADFDPSRGGGDLYVENAQLGTLSDGVLGIQLIVFRGVERSKSIPNYQTAVTVAYIIGRDGVPHRVVLDKVIDLRGFDDQGRVLLSFPEGEGRTTYVVDPTSGAIIAITKNLIYRSQANNAGRPTAASTALAVGAITAMKGGVASPALNQGSRKLPLLVGVSLVVFPSIAMASTGSGLVAGALALLPELAGVSLVLLMVTAMASYGRLAAKEGKKWIESLSANVSAWWRGRAAAKKFLILSQLTASEKVARLLPEATPSLNQLTGVRGSAGYLDGLAAEFKNPVFTKSFNRILVGAGRAPLSRGADLSSLLAEMAFGAASAAPSAKVTDAEVRLIASDGSDAAALINVARSTPAGERSIVYFIVAKSQEALSTLQKEMANVSGVTVLSVTPKAGENSVAFNDLAQAVDSAVTEQLGSNKSVGVRAFNFTSDFVTGIPELNEGSLIALHYALVDALLKAMGNVQIFSTDILKEIVVAAAVAIAA